MNSALKRGLSVGRNEGDFCLGERVGHEKANQKRERTKSVDNLKG